MLGDTITATVVLSPTPNWYDRSIFSGQHTTTVICEAETPPPTTVPPPSTTEPPPPTDEVCVPRLVKFDPPVNGTIDGVTATFGGTPKNETVTITVAEGITVTGVSVKGGSDRNGGGYTTYTSGPFVDLTAPLNPNTDKDPTDTFAISHVIVCGEVTPPPTVPPTVFRQRFRPQFPQLCRQPFLRLFPRLCHLRCRQRNPRSSRQPRSPKSLRVHRRRPLQPLCRRAEIVMATVSRKMRTVNPVPCPTRVSSQVSWAWLDCRSWPAESYSLG